MIQRALVFDYLCHNSLANTARAFVKDSAVKNLDEDGDDTMATEGRAVRDPLAETLDKLLRPAELRKRTYRSFFEQLI